MVRSQQIRRAAFVSVETHSNLAAVLDSIGRQLVPDYSVATFDDLEKAILPVERALTEQSTLLVVDNMESILLPPFSVGGDLRDPQAVGGDLRDPHAGLGETGLQSALSEEARRESHAILQLCERLMARGDTRLVFTSREALPAPFDAQRHRRELHQLDCEDAVKLVERALNREAPTSEDTAAGDAADAARESIEDLVDAVHCHARTLALLAPALERGGVEATRASLVDLMAEMERRYPGSRELSVFASVELSLRRLSPANRDRTPVLGVFHGGVDLDVLRTMMEWEKADVASLARDLIDTGLATPNRYDHLTLNPALCPYLRGKLDAAQRGALTARWVEAMQSYVKFLVQQSNRNAEIAATLTVLELPNLFALLEQVERAGDAAATIGLATSLFPMLQYAGKPRLLDRVGKVRDAAAAALGDVWNHARFETQRTRIEQQLEGGRLREALTGAQDLLQLARAAGDKAYSGADYDLALACLLMARVLGATGRSEQALPLLDEARRCFEAVERDRPDRGAEGMASVCVIERGDRLCDLGRLDEAAAAYDESIRRAKELDNDRQVAVARGQLGTVRLEQRRYQEALDAHEEARERFTRLGEPKFVAVSWHMTGMACQMAGQPEAAEDAYRKSLAIKVELGDVAGQAKTLLQLGNLYHTALDRSEEAAAFYRQAADKYFEIGDEANEGRARNNLGGALHKLCRFDEARQEIRRAIECRELFGHTAELWTSWGILAEIEADTENPTAAAETRRKAVSCYLAYRRDGGENHSGSGRLAFDVTQPLLTGDTAAAASLVQQRAADPELPAEARPFIEALQAIVAGSRDHTLADAPELSYSMAAEILFLIETLQQG